MAASAPPKGYASELAAFMSYRDGMKYASTTVFSAEQLLAITPEEITAYFNVRAYGTPSPTPETKPKVARSNTLLDLKKKISWFMPLREMQWHPISKQGNPTKSRKVNDVVNAVKKAEVRHEGKPLQATRPFALTEFLQILDLVSSCRAEDAVARYRAISMLQWQLIARITCVQHLKVENIVFIPDLPGVLFANVRWSKNVNEERESPTQCLFPSTEPHLCCHIAFAAHAEYFLRQFRL